MPGPQRSSNRCSAAGPRALQLISPCGDALRAPGTNCPAEAGRCKQPQRNTHFDLRFRRRTPYQPRRERFAERDGVNEAVRSMSSLLWTGFGIAALGGKRIASREGFVVVKGARLPLSCCSPIVAWLNAKPAGGEQRLPTGFLNPAATKWPAQASQFPRPG